ncbi:diguanylate cyclase (GGDEF)-like protein [Cytobacillus eiseniae]|uniref:Diguanylate cyclase (GGDEF)-like protein n=1 Tax=Cytobacillus eiseniae TaxID=762947 RepID=A0ABS4RJ04_9BACI|nr:histidine kinase N-terminal 7TM domain-containing protein [Cytobacillus eiseniae]MBP2242753.1 diguanylate cyclase (GGDEF)-like protein [Cytobacillus eiseniae]
MEHELLKYVIVILIAGFFSVFLCGYGCMKMKDAPGARYYILVTFMSAVFTFSYVFELTSSTLEQMKFWLGIEYLAMPFIPVFLLFMCFDYVGQKIKPWMYSLLYVIPIMTIFMHHTNDLHHLYYTSMEFNNDGPFPIIDLEGGPWFYIHSIFLFLCLMISIIILLMQLKKSVVRFRTQILLMVAGLVFPIIANYYYINGWSPYGIDLGPVSMSLSFLFHGIAIVSFQMFNVAPIARDIVFESIQEGVMVLNNQRIIVDYNHVMHTIIPILNTQTIGKPIEQVFDGNPRLLERISNGKACDHQMIIAGEKRYYHIRFSPVQNKNGLHIGKIISFVNITERMQIQEKLEHLASMDGLTKVLNRTFFIKQMEETFESLERDGGSMAVIMFDIDHFKNVNDTFGHEVGDYVLTHVAAIAKESIRATDIMGRYGGEEFIICLKNRSMQEAYALAETIRTRVSEKYAYINKKEIYVTSSFGIAHDSLGAGDNQEFIHSLMRQADQALYAAKRNGRNCVRSYTNALRYTM